MVFNLVYVVLPDFEGLEVPYGIRCFLPFTLLAVKTTHMRKIVISAKLCKNM